MGGAGTGRFAVPVGNDWQEGVCNSKDANIGHTCAVGLFPAGASRWLAERTGKLVCDLGGNVMEWCATKWRESYSTPPDESPEATHRESFGKLLW